MNPSATNLWHRLGLEQSWAVDTVALDTALREAGLRWHPDRFALATDAERATAEDAMSAINEAWRTLRDPFLRAQALLKELGAPMQDGTDKNADPMFLMEMMELKEEAFDAEASGDSSRIRQLDAKFAAREFEELNAFGDAYLAKEAPADLRDRLQRTAYLRRTRKQLNP
ncbi:MAG: Fe-S protein assembly co-chaperone HscB [Planctomycetes bacterium]|jgi:molecular chaperone HscB|nr:Fe-S protein assembly co-chaperone HscB [Planctomycetota bacterium]MBT4029537.1 Fe-S protein assembly co-chaperone HscB [Planctomycetota bacterium]MBT4560593.1 Fe-S protein assembly co-chaperone HscB [Planctomycetota bacterium]MBT5101088.1 Fe-S protein assembly co-chaperone HscB [Planctomycetota bacterium]MBT7013276.1 Fe-S protein assembly co-chaperone HscB [Planctomycetota bacterium]